MPGGSVRAWPNLIWLDQDQKTCENFMKSAKEKAQMNSDEEVPRSGSTGCATLFYSADHLIAAFRPVLERSGAASFVPFVNRKQPKLIAAHESGSTSPFRHYSSKEVVPRPRYN